MKSHIVRSLTAWNTAIHHVSDAETDRKFVEVLMMCVIGSTNLLQNQVDKKYLRFVKGEILFVHIFLLLILTYIFFI